MSFFLVQPVRPFLFRFGIGETLGEGLHHGIGFGRSLADEEVVVAGFQAAVGGKALLFKEEAFLIGQVTADTHVWPAVPGQRGIVHGDIGRVEPDEEIEQPLPFFVQADAGDDLGTVFEMPGHMPDPLVACRFTVGIGQQQDVVRRSLDPNGQRQFLTVGEHGILADGGDFQGGVLVLKGQEGLFGFVLGAIVDHNDLEGRIILFRARKGEISAGSLPHSGHR